MNCEYAREYYNVPACIGRRISYKGRLGIISADRGHYIGVTFDDEQPNMVGSFHPTTEGLEYIDMGKVRKMTRSQRNYREYLDADVGCTFAEWMGFRVKR